MYSGKIAVPPGGGELVVKIIIIIHKLTGTSWGANARTLRVVRLALVYSTAEYCCPVWKNSTRVNKIDAQLATCPIFTLLK
jgi:hypothetical protein